MSQQQSIAVETGGSWADAEALLQDGETLRFQYWSRDVYLIWDDEIGQPMMAEEYPSGEGWNFDHIDPEEVERFLRYAGLTVVTDEETPFDDWSEEPADPADEKSATARLGHLRQIRGQLEDGRVDIRKIKYRHEFGSGLRRTGPDIPVWSGSVDEAEDLYSILGELLDTDEPDRKGDRNENEAVKIIGRVRGRGNVEKVDCYTNHDPFGFVDVVAVGDGPVLFVQVKTNEFTAADRRKYLGKMRRLDFDNARFEVWVRVDREGWRMHRYDPQTESFVTYIEMDSCDHEETVEAYREAVGYYEEGEHGS